MIRISALLLYFVALYALPLAVLHEDIRPLQEVIPADVAEQGGISRYTLRLALGQYAVRHAARVPRRVHPVRRFRARTKRRRVYHGRGAADWVCMWTGQQYPSTAACNRADAWKWISWVSSSTRISQQARLRHVYWEAQNERQHVLVGLTWDVISPLYARTVNFSAGWLAGNIGFRRAQFRYERFESLSDDLLGTLQVSLNQDISPDFPTDPGVRREASNYPVIEARGALTLNPEAGARAATLGVSGHIGETGFDFLAAGPPPLNLPPEGGARFPTWSYNVDLALPIGPHAHLQAEFFRGLNLSPFLGGIGQGVCPCNRVPIDSIGGWADLRYEWTERLSTHVGFGLDDPRNEDFLVGRTYNQFIFANVVCMLTPNLSTGFEVSQWRTLYQDTRAGLIPPSELGPTAPGNAVTVDWMVKYEF